MKTKNLKNLTLFKTLLFGAAVSGIILSLNFVSVGQNASGKFHTEKRAIERDLNNLSAKYDVIDAQERNLKNALENDDEQAAITAKTELLKAKADLKRQKAYLEADKKALACAHKTEMKATAMTAFDQKKELCASKRQLKKDMRRGNASALAQDAKEVAANQRALDQTQAKLDKQQEAYEEDMQAVADDIDEMKAANHQETLAWLYNMRRDENKGKPFFGKAQHEEVSNTTSENVATSKK